MIATLLSQIAVEIKETDREKQIRTGLITPFARINGLEKCVHINDAITDDANREGERYDEDEEYENTRYLDDGDEFSYKARLKSWATKRRFNRCKLNVLLSFKFKSNNKYRIFLLMKAKVSILPLKCLSLLQTTTTQSLMVDLAFLVISILNYLTINVPATNGSGNFTRIYNIGFQLTQ